MNKENRSLLINTGILLLLGVIFIIVFAFLPTSKMDKLFDGKVKVVNVELGATDPDTIKSKKNVLKKDDVVGTIYEVFKENQYGSIELKVIVDNNNVIISMETDIIQSIGQEESTIYVQSFVGSELTAPQTMDGIATPTVSVTLGTIDELLSDIATSQGAKPTEDPLKKYKELYSEITKVANVDKNDNDPETVVEKVIGTKKSERLGYIYEVKKTNIYGSITILIAVNDAGIIEALVPTVDQSIGATETAKYLKGHVGSKITEPAVLDGTALPTVSISIGTATDLLEDLGNVFINDMKVKYNFVEDVEIIEFIEIADRSIIKQQVVLKNSEGALIANVYEGIKNSDFGTLTLRVVVSEDGKIDDINYVLDDSSWEQADKEAYIKSFVGKNLNEINPDIFDGIAGATATSPVIKDILIAISEIGGAE